MSWFSRNALSERLSRFLAEAPHSIKDHLNLEELIRVAASALWAGGGLFGLLQVLALKIGDIFPSPADAGLAAAVLTVLLECTRRLGHGASPPLRPEARARR